MVRGDTGGGIIRSFRRRIDAVLPLRAAAPGEENSGIGFQLGGTDGEEANVQMM
jgi:hypothetical protein